MRQALCATCLILASSAFQTALVAQTQGEITGEVTDASGGLIAGARVILNNIETNASRDGVTNSSGVYRFPSLVPGQYSVKVEARGFRPVARTGIELQVQQVARIDFALQLGSVSDTIEVSAAAPLMETENAATGTVIENRRIVEMPLNGRNFLQLVALSPNVTFGFANSGQAGGRQGGQRTQENISVAGQRSEFNHFTLDGVENTDPNFNTYVFLPSIDVLQEFKVQTGIYPAEFGREASQVNVLTKSGGNAYHGALFEFLRNSQLDADNYSFTSVRNGKDPYKRNQYGFALGGPVWIPKIFNGKNRLFFSANFEGVRDRKALRQIASVPSVAMRSGDFSSLLPRTVIYDPATRVKQASGAITAQAFANNVIPPSLFHPKAIKLLEFYPLPNVPGAGLSNNYQAAESRSLDTDQFTTRIDFIENNNSTWFGRYSHDDEFAITPSSFPKQGYKLQTKAEQALISNTRILNPSVVNEFRFSYSGFHNQNLQYNAYVRNVIGELGGIAGVAVPTPETYGTPAISITGFSGFGENSLAPFINNDHIFQWADNLSIIVGKHSLRTGAEIRRDRFNTEGNQHPRGSFSFQGQATQNPAASANTGYGFADYLLGQVRFDDGALGLAIAQLRSTSQAYFIDDSWKLRPNLTVTLGLRYEYTPPYADKYSGALINVDLPSLFDPARRPTLVRSGTGDFYAGVPFRFAPAIQVARDGRLGDRLLYPDRNDFAPRIGIAYSPTAKWTVRSGFGVFYVQDIGNSKFDLSRNLAARREDTSSNDFPDLTLDSPFRGIGSSLTVVNPLELAVDPHTRTPYILQYLLNVQRQITSNLIAEVGYLGNEGHKLQRHTDYNTPLPGPGSAQANRPFPELGIVQYTINSVNSNYNSLAAKLQQRFAHGVSYLASYTFSKSIDDGSAIRPHGGDQAFPQNPYNLRAERGLSEFDQRHRFVTSMLWDLPAGKGRAWLNQGGPIAYVLGGWQLGGIFTAQSGLPFYPASGADVANIGWAEQRPNYTGAPLDPPGGRTTTQWFNKAAFAPAPAFTFGNAGRNILTGPRLFSLDFSATKQFLMPWEGHQLQFRFEAFNLANHPNFGLPNATITDSAFGRISSTATDMRQIQFALKYTF